MKKVQDFYFKKAKKDGYPARSVYKLEEAQQKFQLLKKGDTVLDLGCQPGSWSMFAAKIVGPQGLIVGVDLEAGRIVRPAGGAEIEFLRGDILAEKTAARVREIRQSFRVIISDMAPRTTGNKWADQQQSLNLARRVLELAGEFLQPGGALCCKVFEGEDFKELVESARKRFQRVKVFKPKSSRPESREVFLVGLGFKK